MNKTMEYKGYNGSLILTDRGVVIKRGLRGFLLGGGFLRGDKTIPYAGIVAVQLKKAGLTAGYIQLTLKGGSESKRGLLQSTRDENSIHFHNVLGKKNNKLFEEARNLIEERISTAVSGGSSGINDIRELASLRDEELITQEEFEAKKKKILGL